jgi:predicted amidohydrolase YtcJ
MKADLVIKSNSIFDSIGDQPFAGFVAIKGNKIIAVSEGDGCEDYIAPHTQVVNGTNKTVVAGFHDSHVHLLMAGMYSEYVNLIDAKSEEEAVQMVKDFADKSPNNDGWIVGFSWYHVFWGSRTLPTKASLDKFFPDRPVLLVNAEAHGVWVNSKALEISGITRDTRAPFGGEIFKDENGEPTGFLNESAAGLATEYALEFSADEQKKLIKAFMNSAAAYGITSINDVQPYFHGNMGDVGIYSSMDRTDELTVRIHAAPDLLGDLDQICKWRDEYGSDKLRVDMAKQFLDGVYTTHTALVLDEYTDAPGNFGTQLTDITSIAAAVPEAHRRGLSVKLHCCGDASARIALDAVEKALSLYGENECRHVIEHCELISDEDRSRFGEYGVIPSMQPEHIALTQTFAENPYPTVIGRERAGKTWPIKSLMESAGVVAFGSDCPVVDSNPFLEIYRAVTRVHNDGQPEGGWNPTEKITLAQALKCYTYGSAYGVRRENEIGSLKTGMFADIAMIDCDIFNIHESELINCKVHMTVMDGKIVYKK